jgi:hypothetical protein
MASQWLIHGNTRPGVGFADENGAYLPAAVQAAGQERVEEHTMTWSEDFIPS